MSNSFELEIRRLLNELEHADLVADQLVKDWDNQTLSVQEISTISRFLYNAGFLPSLTAQCTKALSESKPISWTFFVEALKYSQEPIERVLAEAIILGAESTEHLQDLADSNVLDQFDPRLAPLREEKKANKEREYLSKKNFLLEQIHIVRTQRLFNEEKKLIEQLGKLFPGDTEYERELNNYRQRWASELISQSASRIRSSFEEKFKGEESKELSEAKNIIRESAERFLQNNNQMAYDLTLMMLSLEDPEASLKLLESSPESAPRDWLKIELLLMAKKFLDVLELVRELELKYANNPETFFATSYARAIALWGLKQKTEAINLIRDIVGIRPSYRSAHVLYLEWMGDKR